MNTATATSPLCLSTNQALVRVRDAFELRVSFAVPVGQKILLAGGNGAGKTTLLKLCAGLISPTSGSVERCCGSIGLFLGDTSMLYQDLSFTENARIFTSFRPNKQNLPTLPDLGLSTKDQRRPIRELSAGSRMKASLGITFALGNDILLLDEPSAFLDTAANESLVDYLSSIERTILIATHDRMLFSPICTRCITLESGSIVKDEEL